MAEEKKTYVKQMIIGTRASSSFGVLGNQKDRGWHDGKAVIHALYKQLM